MKQYYWKKFEIKRIGQVTYILKENLIYWWFRKKRIRNEHFNAMLKLQTGW